jgi:hypothetical protein
MLRSSLYDEQLSAAWQIMTVVHILKSVVVSVVTFILPRGLYYLQCAVLFYRVSIKSFPDYKQLLQENYVEYKHFFTIT